MHPPSLECYIHDEAARAHHHCNHHRSPRWPPLKVFHDIIFRLCVCVSKSRVEFRFLQVAYIWKLNLQIDATTITTYVTNQSNCSSQHHQLLDLEVRDSSNQPGSVVLLHHLHQPPISWSKISCFLFFGWGGLPIQICHIWINLIKFATVDWSKSC